MRSHVCMYVCMYVHICLYTYVYRHAQTSSVSTKHKPESRPFIPLSPFLSSSLPLFLPSSLPPSLPHLQVLRIQQQQQRENEAPDAWWGGGGEEVGQARPGEAVDDALRQRGAGGRGSGMGAGGAVCDGGAVRLLDGVLSELLEVEAFGVQGAQAETSGGCGGGCGRVCDQSLLCQ